MKVLLAVMVVVGMSSAFAHNHEETKKKVGHDKEHQHVEKTAADHEHEDGHHEKHDHKAHHPSHDEDVKKAKKK